MSQARPQEYSTEKYYKDESLAAPQSLVLWGMTNVIISIAFLLLNSFLDIPDLTKYFYFSILMFLMVAHPMGRIPLRIPVPILILLVLQVWYCFTTLYAENKYGRDFFFAMTHYHPLGCALCFLNAAALVYIAPQSRRIVITIFMVLATVSAVIALGQVVGVGALTAIGNRVTAFSDINAFLQNSDTVRAPGILAFGHGTVYTIFVMVVVAVLLKTRKLTPGLWVVVGLCAAAAIVPQIRNTIPMLAAGFGTVAWYTYKRFERKALIPLVGVLVGFFLIVYLFPSKFAYFLDFFSGENKAGTFDFRKNVLWPQAMAAYNFSPWTGIGIEPRLAGYPGSADNFVGFGTMDGAFYFALACGGIPALALVLSFMVSSFVSVIADFRQKVEDPTRFRYLVALAVMLVSLPSSLAFGNFFANNIGVMPMFIIAGLCLPDRVEHQNRAMRKLWDRYGRVRPYTAPEVVSEAETLPA